jgi:hypothetical protein
MIIRVEDDKGFSIRWKSEQVGDHFQVEQIDKLGTHTLDFRTADGAGAWIVKQAEFATMEMGYRYTI